MRSTQYISRIILSSIALLIITNVSLAQSQIFTSTEGRLSIGLPTDKATDEPEVNIPDTKPGGKGFRWMFEDELVAFSVIFADGIWAKEGEEKIRAERSADGLVEAFAQRGGVLISRRNVTLSGYPGVEVSYRVKTTDSTLTYLTRYYVAKDRIYSIMGMWMSPNKKARVTKVINSFKILDPPAEPKEKSQRTKFLAHRDLMLSLKS